MKASHIVRLIAFAFALATAAGFAVQPLAAARRSVVAAAPACPTTQSVSMGRGDRRTKKGKIKAGSYGNKRPAKAPLKFRQVKSASYVALNPAQ